MRKKSLNGKRVMAFALAFSLVLGEASAVVAAPADAFCDLRNGNSC